MEILLNRWRGTGTIFSTSKYEVKGTLIYALYIGLLFGMLSTWYIGILSFGLFLLGESMGWGKWIGSLCYPEEKINNLQREYDDLEGYNFPYTHQIANYFIKEREDFFGYCNMALGIRGLWWGLILYAGLVAFGYIGIFMYLYISLAYAVGFPLACYLSTKKYFSYESKLINVNGKWETQEVYYGFIHFLCNMIAVTFILGA